MSPLLTPASSETSCIVSAAAPDVTMLRIAARRIRSAASARGRGAVVARSVTSLYEPPAARAETPPSFAHHPATEVQAPNRRDCARSTSLSAHLHRRALGGTASARPPGILS